MALHDLWESGKSWCMTALFFRADSSSLKAGSLNTVCLTVAPICLNTKTAKKEKKRKKTKNKNKQTLLSMFGPFLQHYLHCRWSARAERASMVGRATEGVWSGAESPTGPLRSASTTGTSGAAASMSVGQSSVQPLPLPEPLPSSPATPWQNTRQAEHITDIAEWHKSTIEPYFTNLNCHIKAAVSFGALKSELQHYHRKPKCSK